MKVMATGAASGSLSADRKGMATRIEAAMSKAILGCAAEGIKDPAKIKERMLAARDKVKHGAGIR